MQVWALETECHGWNPRSLERCAALGKLVSLSVPLFPHLELILHVSFVKIQGNHSYEVSEQYLAYSEHLIDVIFTVVKYCFSMWWSGMNTQQ